MASKTSPQYRDMMRDINDTLDRACSVGESPTNLEMPLQDVLKIAKLALIKDVIMDEENPKSPKLVALKMLKLIPNKLLYECVFPLDLIRFAYWIRETNEIVALISSTRANSDSKQVFNDQGWEQVRLELGKLQEAIDTLLPI
jgi:hypothetical protein